MKLGTCNTTNQKSQSGLWPLAIAIPAILCCGLPLAIGWIGLGIFSLLITVTKFALIPLALLIGYIVFTKKARKPKGASKTESHPATGQSNRISP